MPTKRDIISSLAKRHILQWLTVSWQDCDRKDWGKYLCKIMKFCMVIIAAVSGLARASPLRRECTSKDPKCWQDDGYGGWVWNDNPKYAGDNQGPNSIESFWLEFRLEKRI